MIILVLLGTYVGPYLFVYGRTATWTLPRIDDRDAKAFGKVDVGVDQVAHLAKTEDVNGAQRATYSITLSVLHRKFLDWIGFPIVLEVKDVSFSATGVYQGRVVMECNHFETALDQPPGVTPWYLYQPAVEKNDNNTLTITCAGDATAIDLASLPQNISFNWSTEVTLVGDRNEETRSWSNSQTLEIRP